MDVSFTLSSVFAAALNVFLMARSTAVRLQMVLCSHKHQLQNEALQNKASIEATPSDIMCTPLNGT